VVECANDNRPSSLTLADDVTKCASLKEGKHSEKSKCTESERECAKYSITRNVRSHTHAREKPFKCETCGKGYLYRSHVLTHNCIHIEEKVLT
jgi:hypothetical protein